MYTCSYDRMKDKIETFSKFGDAGHGGITRYSLSPEAIQARNEFRRRMELMHRSSLLRFAAQTKADWQISSTIFRIM